jgi:hypothetical protein
VISGEPSPIGLPLTSARIEQALRPADLDRITALRSSAIGQLTDGGLPQFSLFDIRDMAEISSRDCSRERLTLCKNPLLAVGRRHKRTASLALTEAELGKIAVRVQRHCADRRRPPHRIVPTMAFIGTREPTTGVPVGLLAGEEATRIKRYFP